MANSRKIEKGRIYRAADTIVRPAYLQYMIPDPNFRAYLLEQGYIEEIGENGSRVVVNTCRSGCDEDRLFEAGYRFLSRNRVFPAVGGVELLYEYDIDVGFDAESSFGKVGLFGKLS